MPDPAAAEFGDAQSVASGVAPSPEAVAEERSRHVEAPPPGQIPDPIVRESDIDPAAVIDALMLVTDPELGVDVVSLGLLYGVEIERSDVHVHMTLTSMGCPATALMEFTAREAVGTVDGVGQVFVHWTFDPPWSPERMTEEGREMLQALGFW